MKNLIIEKAYKYNDSPNIDMDSSITYDDTLGFWLLPNESIPLVKSNNSYKPTSKKCDVETGEDKKGE